MARKAAERFTGPGVYVAVGVAAGLIALRPDLSLVALAVAEAIVAGGCAVMVRTVLKRTPPATGAAIVLSVFALFWMGMAALSAMWYLQRV